MFHFPSSSGAARRSEGCNLNATQQKSSKYPIFVKVEEDLHDARRVHADGQEDDLRYALNMVINRVTELSSMLSEAYKAQAELEVQLNVAKSNLKLVIANNEMLEDALQQNMSLQSKDVGWNRTNRESKNSQTNPERSQSLDIQSPSQVPVDTVSSPSQQDNRFFKFRFSTSSVTLSRPITPSGQHPISQNSSHLTSPSLPSFSSVRSKEVEVLGAELEKERASRKKIKEEKAALEAELESLSQALFEEANKMVADERRLRAEFEEELKELKMEKEALQSALRLVASEDNILTGESITSVDDPVAAQLLNDGCGSPHSRTSQIGIKSRPQSLELALLYPIPPSPVSHSEDLPERREGLPYDYEEISSERNRPTIFPDESEPTPHFQPRVSRTDELFTDVSPWADVVSSTTSNALVTSSAR